jgi:cohesin loading factor subunit SCC2
LEVSAEKALATTAKAVHEMLYQKHESAIEAAYIQGIRHAAEYRASRSDNFVNERGGLNPLWDVIKGKLGNRKKLIKNLLPTICDPLSDPTTDLRNHLNYVIFVANGLSCLNFVVQAEVLLVIWEVDRNVCKRGLALIKDMVEAAAPRMNQVWEQLGLRCAVLKILWELSIHLKRQYGLSEDRCSKFDPSRTAGWDNKSVARVEAAQVLDLSGFDLPDSLSTLEGQMEWCATFGEDILNEFSPGDETAFEVLAGLSTGKRKLALSDRLDTNGQKPKKVKMSVASVLNE